MRKLKIRLVIVSVVVLMLALSTGVTFAHPDAPGLGNAPCAPVGSHVSQQGWDNGVNNPDTNAGDAIIGHNPLCPEHSDTPCGE
jgi:hypothetical protein